MNEQITKPISIYSEATPNPESMKFVINRYVIDAVNIYDFPDQASGIGSPFVEESFEFNFVKGVFINANFVTILKTGDDEWFEIIPVLKDFIKNYLESGLQILGDDVKPITAKSYDLEDTDVVKKIKDILNDYVKPAVEQDGGAISYKSYDAEAGILRVSMQGSCAGCPSSMVTLKSGIENLMKNLLPEINEVVADTV